MSNSLVLILLAGGKSSRMGSPKGLLDYNGNFWILEQIKRFKNVSNPKVYIGLGYDYHRYFDEIDWFKEARNNFYNYNGVEVKVLINKQPELGAFSTLHTVLRKINSKCTVLVQPVDVPLLNTICLQQLISCENTVVIPKAAHKNGHPVKLSPLFWNDLLMIDLLSDKARLDIQIKQLSNSSITYVKVVDSSVYQNINTKHKWNLYIKKLHSN